MIEVWLLTAGVGCLAIAWWALAWRVRTLEEHSRHNWLMTHAVRRCLADIGYSRELQRAIDRVWKEEAERLQKVYRGEAEEP